MLWTLYGFDGEELISFDKKPNEPLRSVSPDVSDEPSVFSSEPPSGRSSPQMESRSPSPSVLSSPTPSDISSEKYDSRSLFSEPVELISPQVSERLVDNHPAMMTQSMVEPFGRQDSIRMYLSAETTVLIVCTRETRSIGQSIQEYLNSIYVANMIVSNHPGDMTLASLVSEYKKLSNQGRIKKVDTSDLVSKLNTLDANIVDKTRAMES
jgi:hypothetical protein